MGRKVRITLLVGVILLALAGSFFLGTYWAYRHVPDFYTEALAAQPEQQREASQELSSRVTMLYSNAQRTGDWKALFTEEQLNGWLAVDLIEKHGQMLPPTIHDPRLEITPDGVTLALHVQDESIDAVCSLTTEIYLAEPNVVAFRLRKVRAGALPIPMSDILEHVTKAAEQLHLDLRWTHIEDDPVALLTIDPQHDKHDNVLLLDVVELHDKEIFLSGRTVPTSEAPKLNQDSGWPARVAREIYARRSDHN